MHLHELISPDRISFELKASSKKRLLEELSLLIYEDVPGFDKKLAFQSLIDRERLGSTGMGNGVALPHARVAGLKKAVGAFAVLQEELDFEAIDNQPVNLVFALLVPEEATEEHLQLLSQLSHIFGNNQNREHLRNANSCDEVYNFLCAMDSEYQRAS